MCGQIRARLTHGLHDKVECIDVLECHHTIDIGGFTHGVVNHGALAQGVLQIKSHGFEDGKQVGKYNGRVHP